MNAYLRWRNGWVAVVCLAAASGAMAELRRDVEYGCAGGERLLLDASVPEGEGPFPIAILVHGGGWSSGDKAGSNRPGDGADISPWFETLTTANYTWFSINYRLAPKHSWPAAIEDVKTAIAWVKAHAAEFKGDARRVVLFGHSAGGHLVMFAATAAAKEVDVQAVVGFAPVTDLVSDTERRGGPSQSLQNLFHIGKEMTPETRERLAACSPVNFVTRETPPVLIVHGDADKTVPIAMAQAFIAKAKEAGVPAEIIVRPGVPHSLVAGEKLDPSYREPMLAWLAKTLKSGKR